MAMLSGEEEQEDPMSVIWSWAMETLAGTKQVDTPILNELLGEVPNGYDSLSTNAKETIALRLLEDMFGTPNPTDVASSSAAHCVGVNVTESAQDVYQRLRDKEKDESSSRAVRGFILQKRAQLPKLGLQEVEDLLTIGRHLFPASLRKQSGLTMEQGECSRNPDQTQTPQVDFTRSGVAEILDNLLQDDRVAKSPNSTANIAMEMQVDLTRFVSENLNKSVQDDCGAKSPNSTPNMDMEMHADSTHLVSENLDNLEQDYNIAKSPNPIPKIDTGMQLDSTRLVSENLDNLVQDDCGAKSPNPTGMGMQPDSTCLVSENLAKSSNCIPNIGMGKQPDSTRLVSANLDNLVQDNCRAKSPNPTANIDTGMQPVVTRLVSENSANSTTKLGMGIQDVDYCIKCKKRGGRLLVCSSSFCRIAVHRSCLNCEAYFDGTDEFYCPICSNLRASIALDEHMTKLEQARKKVMLAKDQMNKSEAMKAEKEAASKAGKLKK